jgi:small-conductance mechanosensitive channel
MGEGQREMTRSSFIIAVLLTCLGASARAEQAQVAEPAVLSLWNRPIVTFRATVDGMAPAQRVRNSRRRIDEHLEAALGGPVATRVTTIGEMRGILVTTGPDVAFGLVEGDLDAEGATTLEQAAARAAGRLRDALQAREQQQRPGVLAWGIGVTLIALPVFILVIKLILMGRELAIRQVDRRLKLRHWVIGGVDILPTLATVERATFRVLTWGVIAAVTYLLLLFVLQAFPYTEPLGERLGDYLWRRLADACLAIFKSAPNIIAIVAVIFMTRSISLWVARVVAEVEHGVREMTWLARGQARATRRIVTGLIWVLGFAVAYSLLPWSNNPIFQGMSIVLGLAASLASAGLVNQWISGVVVLYSRSFRIGDYVKIGDVEGYVTEIGPLATKLHTIRREEITVPNAVVTSNKLINFSQLGDEQGALLSVSLAIGYDVPWRRVESLLLQAAAETAGVRLDPSPRVLRWELTDFFVEYQLHIRLENAEHRATVRSALNSKILDEFMAANVQIMTPHFESQPDKPVIPDHRSVK